MNKLPVNFKVYVLLMLTLLFWASAFVGIKFLLRFFEPTQIAFIRFFFASLFFILIGVFTKIRVPKKEILHIVASALFGITLYNILLNYSETLISSAESSFIINLVPIFTTILAFMFLKEKIRKCFILKLALSFLGVFLISYSHISGFSLQSGVLYALLASFSQAVYFILQKKLLLYYKPIEIVSYSVWLGTIFMLPFHLDISSLNSINISPEVFFVFLYLALFPSTLAYLFWAYVLYYKKASDASVYLYLVPFITLIIGYFLLDERLNSISLIGGLIILLALSIKLER